MVPLLLVLLTVGLGALFFRWNMDRLHVKQVQRDVYQRIMRDRLQILANSPAGSPDPYAALNEACAAFSKSPGVIAALAKLNEQWADPRRLAPNLVTALKEMAAACGAMPQALNDDYFLNPFQPPIDEGDNDLSSAS